MVLIAEGSYLFSVLTSNNLPINIFFLVNNAKKLVKNERNYSKHL